MADIPEFSRRTLLSPNHGFGGVLQGRSSSFLCTPLAVSKPTGDRYAHSTMLSLHTLHPSTPYRALDQFSLRLPNKHARHHYQLPSTLTCPHSALHARHRTTVISSKFLHLLVLTDFPFHSVTISIILQKGDALPSFV